MESPSRRGRQVAQVDRMAQAATERRVGRIKMPHAGYTNSVTNDRPGPCMDISSKELPEPVTPAIEVTLPTPVLLFQCMSIHSSILIHAFIHLVIYSSIHSSHTSKHRICNYCITTLHVASRSGSRLIQHEGRLTRVRRSAHDGLKAALCQTELGEKM